ncbi:hypothetical protein EYF80_051062 [Liparis tanakae]|uniref:Uncharacterized protein n=1 Tax=Liparis tanakae TaxID=230148 RepID=A0A4Z2FCZ7_9TELE|nr:hypothetical protein EYF80_051062 [Liparis tanakae]
MPRLNGSLRLPGALPAARIDQLSQNQEKHGPSLGTLKSLCIRHENQYGRELIVSLQGPGLLSIYMPIGHVHQSQLVEFSTSRSRLRVTQSIEVNGVDGSQRGRWKPTGSMEANGVDGSQRGRWKPTGSIEANGVD